MMHKTTRRGFLTTTVMTATAAAACGRIGAQQPANRVRGNPFTNVKDIPASESHIPSEQYPPPFPPEEFAGRLARVRKAMADMKVDLLWTGWPDAMLYLHGYEMTWYDPTRNPRMGTAVHVEHDKQIFVGGEDVQFSAATDRRPIRGQATDYGNAVANLLKQEGWLKKGTVVGMEFSRYLPTPAVSRRLETAFMNAGASVVDATTIIGTVRNIKSPAEIAAVEQAARIADIGIRAVADMLKPGVTSAEIYAAAYSAMAKVGGEVPAIPQSVQPGRPATTHNLPSRREVQAGESFAFDLAGVYKRYHANLDRTFIYGDPNPELVRIHKVTLGAIDILRATGKAGTPVSVVNRALRDYYKHQDIWKYQQGPLGYELGASLPPDWCGDFWFNVSNENDQRVFQENMVTNYETRFRKNQPEARFDLMAHARDTVIYTPSGARVLSTIPCDLIVVG
jgi:Xaa-Pro aminopeptidase